MCGATGAFGAARVQACRFFKGANTGGSSESDRLSTLPDALERVVSCFRFLRGGDNNASFFGMLDTWLFVYEISTTGN